LRRLVDRQLAPAAIDATNLEFSGDHVVALLGRSTTRKQIPSHFSEFLQKYLPAAFTEKLRVRGMLKADIASTCCDPRLPR
jgi:hypothetical protein